MADKFLIFQNNKFKINILQTFDFMMPKSWDFPNLDFVLDLKIGINNVSPLDSPLKAL